MPLPALHRRTLLRLALGAAAGAGAALNTGCARPQSRPGVAPSGRLALLAHGSLPTLGAEFDGVVIGGLSALAYDPAGDLWYTLSDARGQHGAVRCFTFRLAPLDGSTDIVPRWQSVIWLRDASDKPIRSTHFDPEGLALRHDATTGARTLFWSSEGHIREGVAPAIYAAAPDGRMQRPFQLPALLRELGREERGPQNNRTLEGIALTPDGRHLWAAMEGALRQDETEAQRALQSGPRRLTRLAAESGRADRQIAYLPDPLPSGLFTPPLARWNGISDLLVASADELWILERAFTPSTGFRVRLYAADLRAASNTLGQDALREGTFAPAPKRLLVDFSELGVPAIDNLEGMARGPSLADGAGTLLLVSDDNFSALQRTQFIALRVENAAKRSGQLDRRR